MLCQLQRSQLLKYEIIFYVLSMRMKPFIDAEVVKEYFINISNLLFDKFTYTNQIISEIEKMLLFDSFCIKRIENIAKHTYL